jgi:hypothetical protein
MPWSALKSKTILLTLLKIKCQAEFQIGVLPRLKKSFQA